MGSWSKDKQAAAGGVLAMVLLIVGNFMYGSPPRFDANAAKVVSFYDGHHRTILVGMILTGLAIPFYVWFIAHLANIVGGAQGRVIGYGGLLVAACAATGDALTAAGSHAARLGDSPTAIRLLWQLSSLAYSRLFWPGIAIAVVLAMYAAGGGLKMYVRWIAWIQIVVFVLGGIALKETGFFSPDGGMAVIAYVVYFVGTGLFAFAMWQSAEAPAPAAAHSTA